MNQVVENKDVVNSMPEMVMAKETFFQKFFSFKGRLGRENFFKRYLLVFLMSYGGMIAAMILVGLLGLFVSLAFPRRMAGVVIGILAFIGIGALLIGVIGMVLSLVVRRLHDLGYSGWWILGAILYAFVVLAIAMVSIFAFVTNNPEFAFETISSVALIVNLILLLMLPVYVAAFALIFWPGQTVENQYGLPPRARKVTFASSWNQVKKEFFSFSGRLNRKWFIGMMVSLGLMSTYFGAAFLIYGVIGIGAAFIGSSVLTGVISGLSVIIGLGGVVVGSYSCLSLLARRVQDMGYSRWIGIGFFFFQILLGLIMIGLVANLIIEIVALSSYRRGPDFTELIGTFKGISVISSLSFLGQVLMMALPGTKGGNQYGPNPVEVGLLPGEESEVPQGKVREF